MFMSAISTHVLDLSSGGPATGVHVTLELREVHGDWRVVGRGDTDQDGRLATLLPNGTSLVPGEYRLTFSTRDYFQTRGVTSLYPSVAITIEVLAGQTQYHVPLLLSPFGYTTYRGS
jgi:5-hydroxyisourate hydrolase